MAEEIVGEIQFSDHGADQRHDDIVDQRVHDLAEGRADDDADRKVDRVPLDGELPEFVQHAHGTSCCGPEAGSMRAGAAGWKGGDTLRYNRGLTPIQRRSSRTP
jgi:hypothetical protein